jgi:hypothetical protein
LQKAGAVKLMTPELIATLCDHAQGNCMAAHSAPKSWTPSGSSSKGMDDVTVIDPEVRGIVERNWPHLLAKLPPEDD